MKCIWCSSRTSRPHPATMSSLGEAIIHLAIDLFHQIRQSEKENIFLSPFSISSALAMTYLGARENTASEMEKVGAAAFPSQVCTAVCWLACRWPQVCLSPVPREARAAPRLGGHRGGHALSRRAPPCSCAWSSSGGWDDPLRLQRWGFNGRVHWKSGAD